MRDSAESVPQNSRRPTLASTKYSMRLTSHLIHVFCLSVRASSGRLCAESKSTQSTLSFSPESPLTAPA
ncbi:uncharacterized protein ASPGLDRAFT_473499 [Aspergillus glaucus CBS 516.65]|uniref:Uncharacterized protein n=1 Tax=Aspergillus glaucus CBS 516.65 TaxID=1160497 RepID=A0A1L9VH32_ASPGL|nr:hypothetical protein ASPGLDRAFT_473499 [Aspergillus glaucus CBS 516.65]OJJ83241.1 hypothetical protein ASPGLDRAFT_473499 [Aspergillus glaucus CBS 516.65]